MAFDKKAYRKKYYQEHKQQEKDYQKKTYWKNPEKNRKNAIEYRRNNPEKRKETKRKCDLKHKDRVNEYNREYYLKNKDKFDKNKKWSRFIYTKYGITAEEYEALRIKQNNRCGICNKLFKERRPDIDHKHDQSKKVRGLLCSKCNCALGLFRDKQDSLFRALDWIKRNGS